MKNNWCEDRRRRPFQDMNRICNSVEEEHVSISEFHLAVQEQKILEQLQHDMEVLCVWLWCFLWFGTDKMR